MAAARIVVINQDRVISTMIARLLLRSGHSAVQFNDCACGTAGIVQHRPDLALLDLDLPGLDAQALIRQTRSNPATAVTRFILLSQDDIKAHHETAMQTRADDFVCLDWIVNKLPLAVCKALERARLVRKAHAVLAQATRFSAL